MKKKVLIIRLTSLGDVIFTLPLVNSLKNKGYTVDFVVAEKGEGIIKNNPAINKYFLYPLAKWRKNKFNPKNIVEFFKLISDIRKEKYDFVIDCQQMFKSLFLFLFCGGKRRLTFKDAKELSFLGGNEFVKPSHKFKDNKYHIVSRNLEFAEYLGIKTEKPIFSLPVLSEEIKNKVSDLLKNCKYGTPLMVLAPATTWKNKHWKNENWTELIKKLLEQNKYNLVITGTKNDVFFINGLINKIPNKDKIVNLCGKTNFEELQGVLSCAEKVITLDNGTAHLAWATGKPDIISIFTCTPPLRFAPFGSQKYKFLCGNLPCQFCFTKKCRQKNAECRNYPSVDEVLSNL